MADEKYPIGTQTFSILRSRGYVYVDKTEYIHKLINSYRFVFLSRPRRFGKSLLISTLESFFKGRRELFKGLAIDRLMPEEWCEYPVVHLDMSGNDYNSEFLLANAISTQLDSYEQIAGISHKNADLSNRLAILLNELHRKYGRKVVVLVDEYDNPITQTIGRDELQNRFREILYSFYSTLKRCDSHIQFGMLTGITKYGKLSVFSGLNNLKDISFDNEFAGICGITEEELQLNFRSGVEKLAIAEEISTDEAFQKLKSYYDGYHFSRSMLDVYNPYSLLNALADKEIKKYWYETATPSLLVNVLKNSSVDLDSLENSKATESSLNDISSISIDPLALFYQTGYLTLRQYDKVYKEFTLGFPNREVESGFKQNLLNSFANVQAPDIFINKLKRALDNGDAEGFIGLLRSFLSDIPLKLLRNLEKYENYYHTILYSVFTLLGLDTTAEYGTSDGYIDLLVKTSGYIYVIELKINGTAADAMAQIERKQYARPFEKDGRKIVKIGIGFAESTHSIDSAIIG